MTKKIFRSICLAAIAVLLASLVLIMGVLYDYFAQLQRRQLAVQTDLAAQGLMAQGMEYFDGLQLADCRLTWIAADGAVLYDIRENRYLDVFALEQLAAVQVEGIIEAEGAHAFVNVLRDNTLLIYYGEFRNDAERDRFEHLRRSPYRNYTGKRFRNDAEREQVLYIMALTRTDHAQKIAGRIQEQLGGRVRVMLYPASEYEGYTYLKVYAADACKANMLKILQTRIGAERVITFGSIPGQYDVYVHDDGGNSAVKMLKKLYEGKKLEDVLN